MKTYAIPADVLQAVVQLLNSMPALQSRSTLNAIEALLRQQDQAAKANPAGGGGPAEE
jgi:hypothetical protein